MEALSERFRAYYHFSREGEEIITTALIDEVQLDQDLEVQTPVVIEALSRKIHMARVKEQLLL